MSVSWNGPSYISPETGSAHSSVNYELDTTQNDAYTGYTSRTYEHQANQQNTTAGITFYYDATTAKQYVNVNIVGNTTSPDYVVNTTTNTGGSGVSEVEYTTGDVIQTWSSSYSVAPLCIFTTTSAMNFVVASGPTVTSITVANEIASTRQFTVTHTGTLSASDIAYTIDGVDITSLGSPNTPITNLQTTSTGSTFDSYTVSKYGTHSINIGEKYLNFLVATSTTNQGIFSSNNNITVNFPALSSGTYENNLGTLVSGAGVDSVTYGSQRIKIKISKDLILMYVWIYENYNTYQAGIHSFKVLIQQWDYGNLSGYSQNTPEYISDVYYVKPDTLYESTGSPNTLLTFPTGMLVDTYNWNFATDNNVPISTTTSNGGGKPDRYPLIMTNLFNRNRSLYSIGMTHKDTWDLFL